MQRHHLRTKREDKALVERICRDCHKTIHGLWTNPELRDPTRDLDTVEGILGQETFKRALTHIQRLTPGAYMRMRQAKRRRGRN